MEQASVVGSLDMIRVRPECLLKRFFSLSDITQIEQTHTAIVEPISQEIASFRLGPPVFRTNQY
jgi:hypothetical protein